MANIRYTDKSQTYVTVVVDQLAMGAGDHSDINLYVNGAYETSMIGLSGAGGSAGNYRTGTYTVSGLNSGTTYYFEARIRETMGGAVETVGMNVTTDSPPKPAALSWSTRVTGQNFYLSASDWNSLTSKINEWRIYQGNGTMSFTTAYSGSDLTASMFNQVRNAIEALNPPTVAPASVSSGDPVTAAKINRLGDSVNSLI